MGNGVFEPCLFDRRWFARDNQTAVTRILHRRSLTLKMHIEAFFRIIDLQKCAAFRITCELDKVAVHSKAH